jgi:serine O-acetyltransferase
MKFASVISTFVKSVRADFGSMQRYQAKYHADHITGLRLPAALVTKIGFQMLTSVRIMEALDQAHVPLLPQVASRLIRHLYGAEIHWKAKIDPGVSVVHGNGLVISKEATIGSGCILFHNVTLGQGIDPVTRVVGGPTLGTDVHVGPGAVLIGPIHIGDGTKIMAGAVVSQSVPPRCVVRTGEPKIITRSEHAGDNAESDIGSRGESTCDDS